MGDSFGSKDAPCKTYPVISVTIDNVPAGAEVYIANQKAEVSGNTYKVTVDNGIFAKIASFFSNFLFNLFKRKEVPVNFGKSK